MLAGRMMKEKGLDQNCIGDGDDTVCLYVLGVMSCRIGQPQTTRLD